MLESGGPGRQERRGVRCVLVGRDAPRAFGTHDLAVVATDRPFDVGDLVRPVALANHSMPLAGGCAVRGTRRRRRRVLQNGLFRAFSGAVAKDA